MKRFLLILPALVYSFFLFSCDNTNDENGNDDNNSENDNQIETGLISPNDFEYIGAFRMPDGTSTVQSWEWGGYAMTYYPKGDPSGADDGYPGSLYVAGHAWEHQLSEISIPVPVNSAGKNLDDLNTAVQLQPFYDIFDVRDLEIPRSGIAYLPGQGSQNTDKLHFCWGYHMQETPADLTHGWCELNLSDPKIKRGWYLKAHPVYIQNMSTNDYMFDIPKAWADEYVQEMYLATGRYRDGGWSGQGPSLFAIAPWKHGNPPQSGTGIDNITLILYTSTNESAGGYTMDNYHHSDEWSGGAWLTAGDKAAVVFVGTKGVGECWYGDPNGPCIDCEERGWWSSKFKGQFVFYSPSDLAAVAEGSMQTYEPQPYATMDIDQYLYTIKSDQQKHHLGAAAYDNINFLFYVVEFRGDGDKPLIHVWNINQ